MTTSPVINDLKITKFIPAPPEQVFDAWVTPEKRKEWWAAQEGMCCDDCTIDARVDGLYRINMWAPDRTHEYVVTGEFKQFERPNRLVMTWSWEPGSADPNEPGSFATGTTGAIDFEPTEGGTLIHLHHSGFADAIQRDNHQEGWLGCLGKLADTF